MTAPEAAVRASAALNYGDDTKITDDRIASMQAMIRREGNGAAMVRSLEKFTLPDPTPDLARIAVPTLIVWGTDDALIPVEQGYRMRDIIPGAEMITYDGVGHAAQEEIPERTVADAIAFLDRISGASSAASVAGSRQ